MSILNNILNSALRVVAGEVANNVENTLKSNGIFNNQSDDVVASAEPRKVKIEQGYAQLNLSRMLTDKNYLQKQVDVIDGQIAHLESVRKTYQDRIDAMRQKHDNSLTSELSERYSSDIDEIKINDDDNSIGTTISYDPKEVITKIRKQVRYLGDPRVATIEFLVNLVGDSTNLQLDSKTFDILADKSAVYRVRNNNYKAIVLPSESLALINIVIYESKTYKPTKMATVSKLDDGSIQITEDDPNKYLATYFA